MSGLLSPALTGTMRYEVLLAVRRRVSWLSLLPLCLLALLLALTSRTLTEHTDPVARIGDTATMVNVLGSIGIAIALADRLAEQRRPGLAELVGATPAGPASRAAGIVLGPLLVALAPVGSVLLAVGGWLAVHSGSIRPLGAAVVALVVIVAPGSLLLTMVANLLALLLPAAAARVLVVPLWYWATALSPLIPVPTVTGTVFSPLGSYQAEAWLGTRMPQVPADWLHPLPGQGAALLALGVTLGAALLVFGVCQVLIRFVLQDGAPR